MNYPVTGGTGRSSEANSGPISIKDAYDVFSSQINKEDQLIISRMSWGLTSNGAIITLFGALYAFLNSPYADLNTISRDIILVLSCIAFFIIAFEIYYQAIQAIWVAREQLYAIRKTYHSHWGPIFRREHLPMPYGGKEAGDDHAYREPSFFAYPTIVLRRWMPFGSQLHGLRLGPVELVHLPCYRGERHERVWFAEKILFAGLCMWIIVFLIITVSVLSPKAETASPHAGAFPSPSRAP